MNTRAPWVNLIVVALLAGCAGPRFDRDAAAHGDAEFSRLSRLARAAYEKGSLAQAETLYRQAHRRAQELDDAAQIGDSAYNLAAVLIAQDQTAPAWPLLDEAEAELQHDGQSPVDIWLVKARLALAEKRTADALHWVEAVDTNRPASPAQRAQAALLRGEIACDGSDAAQAHKQLEFAKQLAVHASPFTAAQIEKLSGRTASLKGEHKKAAAAFDREADLYRDMGQQRALAQALARASDAFAKVGDTRAAAERAYRAARSFLAQGQTSAAQPLIARGSELARASGDEALQKLLRQLAAEAASAQR